MGQFDEMLVFFVKSPLLFWQTSSPGQEVAASCWPLVLVLKKRCERPLVVWKPTAHIGAAFVSTPS